MPRATKSTSSTTEVPSSTILSGNIELSAPQVSVPKTKKSTKSKTDTTVETVAPVDNLKTLETVPVVSETIENVVLDSAIVAESDLSLVEQSQEFFSKLQQLGTLISSVKTEYRTLEKKWVRDLKAAQKKMSKGKRNAAASNGGVVQTRTPSGFVKPTRISDELALFLGKEKGTEMARTAVTRDINAYIRTNQLQDAVNGRKIIPDTKLSALLKLSKEDELTYFNLQKYMSPHFQKNVKVDASATVPVSTTVPATV